MKKLAVLLIGLLITTSCGGGPDKTKIKMNPSDADRYITKLEVMNYGQGHRYSVRAHIPKSLETEEVDHIMKQVARYVVENNEPGSVAVNAFDPGNDGMAFSVMKYAPHGDWTSYDLESVESYQFVKEY